MSSSAHRESRKGTGASQRRRHVRAGATPRPSGPHRTTGTLMRPFLVTLTFALAGIGSLTARTSAQIVPYDATLYGSLAAAWQQYVMSLPLQANPTTDLSGVHALVGQSGPVYFLTGAPTTEPVTRRVTLPAGKFLFFPLVTVECSTVEPDPFHGTNFAELSGCAASFFGGTDALTCAIDGVAVT